MRLASLWYGSHPLSLVLAPLGWLFCLAAAARRHAYRVGLLHSERLPVPVIVVGNITVGGTGKTPLVIWLVEALRKAGRRPGVVSRGYGGGATHWPQTVYGDSDPFMVGDEPVLIASRAECPVMVGPRRAEAARKLLEDFDCDVIVCDDGLQHYALARDLEIAVVDGARRLGNGRCLPAGPLRELPSRLRKVDMVMVNGAGHPGEHTMQLVGDSAVQLQNPGPPHALESWRGKRVHGVAGIGNPDRFFSQLRDYGIDAIAHPFPDHYRYNHNDVNFPDDLPVIMTEKDAVKCRDHAQSQHWYVPVTARLDTGCEQRLLQLLTGLFERRAVE